VAVDTGVLMYGHSLLMAGLAAQLEACGGIRLASASANCASLLELVDAHDPDVLLYDLSTTSPDFAVPLLRSHPKLVVIGMHPSVEALLVLIGRSMAASCVAELVDVIQGVARSVCDARKPQGGKG
jgi:DNA-binding NarL/FixJ family response regulator